MNLLRETFWPRVKPLLHKCGLNIVGYPPSDFDSMDRRVFDQVKDFTMTSPERVRALVDAVRYLVKEDIKGDLVECGVAAGGSAMAMAITLQELGDTSRNIYLYDTFSDMPQPADVDVSSKGVPGKNMLGTPPPEFSLENVKKMLFGTGYPKEKLHFIKGKVEDTIPGVIPSRISLLRLDTDWYESTKHELTHLFPILSPRGIIIIDDYGQWLGAKKAVDEYISTQRLCMFLNRIDVTGRIAVKMPV